MRCTECRVEAEEGVRGWQAHRADLEGEEPELAFYCPACAEREFHGDEIQRG
jgi:hypothetical protein